MECLIYIYIISKGLVVLNGQPLPQLKIRLMKEFLVVVDDANEFSYLQTFDMKMIFFPKLFQWPPYALICSKATLLLLDLLETTWWKLSSSPLPRFLVCVEGVSILNVAWNGYPWCYHGRCTQPSSNEHHVQRMACQSWELYFLNFNFLII